jgi:hypothetical protein
MQPLGDEPARRSLVKRLSAIRIRVGIVVAMAALVASFVLPWALAVTLGVVILGCLLGQVEVMRLVALDRVSSTRARWMYRGIAFLSAAVGLAAIMLLGNGR